MASNLPVGFSLRHAIVRSVGRTYLDCEYTDGIGDKIIRCPIPQPYPGKGGGVLVGFNRGTRVLIATGQMEQPFIVGTIPEREFYFDQAGLDNANINHSAFPKLSEGEICLKGPTGARVDLLSDGSLCLNVGAGDLQADVELAPESKTLYARVNNSYRFSEAGRFIEGVIKRDKSEEEQPVDSDTTDFLSGEAYDDFLSHIGRSPEAEVQYRTTTFVSPRTRNPSLIENRSIIYEYADSFGVRGLEFEARAMEQTNPDNLGESLDKLVLSNASRSRRRTDILNINLRNYNHLIEKVEGTVVDIYGNILDINRNIIPVPGIDTISTKGGAERDLRNLYTFLRRSIKSHYEINSRKDINGTEPADPKSSDNAKEHSRWSMDIDGEGLTKINIPASSETGNIPVLSRYLVSRDPDDKDSGAFKDDKRRDIRIAQFGATDGGEFAGQTIDNSAYIPETRRDDTRKVTVGTAFHDMLNIASSIFENGKLKDASDERMASSINNKIGDDNANAGGRSLHANLDGSIEMSVGADTVDRKSLLLDLAGAVISHYGRDRNGRSIIHQSDGDVIIQVGGNGVDDKRFPEDGSSTDKPGRVEIHLNRVGGDPQRIVIDEDGITIDINGNGVFSTTGSLTLSAGGQLLLHGEVINMYGSHDEDISGTRNALGFERHVLRNGQVVI